MARAAGSFAQLLSKEGAYAQLRMPSGEVRRVPVECRATVGQVGNVEHENISLGKAGRTRWRGIRPHVRGVAMNPDRKSTRLNSSHANISYAVFCLKKK